MLFQPYVVPGDLGGVQDCNVTRTEQRGSTIPLPLVHCDALPLMINPGRVLQSSPQQGDTPGSTRERVISGQADSSGRKDW